MCNRGKGVVALIFIILFLLSSMATASNYVVPKGKTAIIIASFGTTVPSAIKSITNIIERVKNAYPGTEVRVTFTSNIIRSVWKKRQSDPQKWLDMGIPREILYVENIISTLGDLRDGGYRNIIVQPTHMFFMEQSYDLKAYVEAFNSIKTMKKKWRPFESIVMGRPALGMPGDVYSYHDDVAAAVKTLEGDIKMAEKEGAMLIYMGHGNEHWSTGIYGETQKKMREMYPGVVTFIGVVEGAPALEDFLGQLKQTKNKKIVLRPFMIVAGDHAVNDMAGTEEDSWKSLLVKEGYDVQPVLEGLGSNDQFADLFVKHIADAAREKNITLQ
ncbi:MAG: sirohydrochlorin cobaltochelatase [Desulfobulbaceae bacterium]|nr:sirohydrochlorin cobaltochelatase [Desulfobulbaceae bacterium]